MGDLLRAYKRGDKIAFQTALQRALTTIKTESTQRDNVPQKLKEQWAKEDAEIALKNDETPRSSYIPESLKKKWEKEDIARKLREE